MRLLVVLALAALVGCASSAQCDWVVLEFEVTDSGRVEDPRVLDSCPPGKFDAEALKAIRKFRYEPGEPRTMKTMLRF